MDAGNGWAEVAAVLSCLGAADAEQILRRLPTERAALLRQQGKRERASVGPRWVVVQQFVQEVRGVENHSAPRVYRLEGAGDQGSVSLLQRQLPSRLAAILVDELPSTAAAALLLLSANKAADVLLHLPRDFQRAVAEALRDADPLDESIRRDLIEMLCAKLSHPAPNPHEGQPDGAERLEEILSFADEQTRQWLAG